MARSKPESKQERLPAVDVHAHLNVQNAVEHSTSCARRWHSKLPLSKLLESSNTVSVSDVESVTEPPKEQPIPDATSEVEDEVAPPPLPLPICVSRGVDCVRSHGPASSWSVSSSAEAQYSESESSEPDWRLLSESSDLLEPAAVASAILHKSVASRSMSGCSSRPANGNCQRRPNDQKYCLWSLVHLVHRG